ncbi:MAG TPA: hypothetical protein VI454_18820 [Verrucomicrobiae bacterium]|jgi:hypothetical protein
MSSNTVPLALPDDLYEEVKAAAAVTHLSVPDVVLQSMKLGLPKLRERLAAESGRITNVDPLPDEVLAEIYARPERDEAGIDRLVAAQAKGVRD